MKGALFGLVALLVLGPISAASQPVWHEETRFVYEPGVSPDGLGESVAVHGERAILGAPAVGIANASAGYAVTVRYDDGSWTLPQKLQADDGQLDDRFGFSVAIDGALAVVGAPEADFMGDRTGAAYVFGLESGDWIQQHSLLPEDGNGGLEFGTSVAVHGGTVLVGAPVINIGELQTGEAYIYETEDGDVAHEQRLQFGDFSSVAAFGRSVALGENLAVIGVPNRGPGAQNFGSVVLYDRQESGWEFKQEIEASDAEPQDVFGSSVSVDGEWLFVGAPREDDGAANAGAVYVFGNSEGSWTQVDRLKAPTPIAEDRFGESVAVSGDRAVVGSSSNDEQGSGAGTLYTFAYDGGEWQFVEQLFASDASIGDDFGASVAIDGDVIVAGAAGSNGDDSEESVGTVYFFRQEPPATSIGEMPGGSDLPVEIDVYPHPVREGATLEFTTRQTQYVDVSIYDLLGRRVQLLHSGELRSDQLHRFDVRTDQLSSGVYIVRLRGEWESATRRIVLYRD
jgi:hypothetical protein